ncbi:hypothetical protein ABZ468_55355, partial [Streptomyces sp. NPDC005708]|uniref:hypothetical protein n=1 Tax=Streptomyces sp. NPDC005708 TaxID=3154564 RepID=UPI0033FC2CC1
STGAVFTCFRGPPPTSTPQARTIQALAGALGDTLINSSSVGSGALSSYGTYRLRSAAGSFAREESLRRA